MQNHDEKIIKAARDHGANLMAFDDGVWKVLNAPEGSWAAGGFYSSEAAAARAYCGEHDILPQEEAPPIAPEKPRTDNPLRVLAACVLILLVACASGATLHSLFSAFASMKSIEQKIDANGNPVK